MFAGVARGANASGRKALGVDPDQSAPGIVCRMIGPPSEIANRWLRVEIRVQYAAVSCKAMDFRVIFRPGVEWLRAHACQDRRQ